MFCTQCGNQIDEGNNFCGNCGARVGRGAEQASDTRTPPAAAAPAKPSYGGKSLAIVGSIVLVLVAGLYFGAGLLRKSDYPESRSTDDRPGGVAGTADSPAPMEDRPGRSAATVGAPPPMDDRPGRPAGTVGAPPPSPSRRAADTGVFETVRDTSVFERPSASSRVVANIPQGVRVNVVGSSGDWLQVRSKTGKPPGFIRRSDATFVEKPG